MEENDFVGACLSYSGEKSHAYVTFFGKDEMKRPPERLRVDGETL
jgi:hypothetical protein